MKKIAERLGRYQAKTAAHPSRQPAAVALILAPGPELLLVRRAIREGDRWSGHMALPGGRFEEADKDLFATVLRETLEETGVALTRRMLLGSLDDLAPISPTLPPVVVRPFVFSMKERPALRLNEELTGVHWFKLDVLAASACETDVEIGGASRKVKAFVPEPGIVVWGMTHRIVDGFLALVS
jgi:8-oxo-dGTP pyrophosphatase MutT (NUDIX family)